MRILAFLVRMVLLVAPRLRRLDPVGLVEEVLRNLRKEMDFRQEARNIRRFTEIFRDSPTIFVPAAIEGMQTEWISVQHMSGGYRIDDAGLKESGPMLAQAFVDAYLKQFFSVGVFHGDPHPGNLFIMQDGRICFHDFGLVGFLTTALAATSPHSCRPSFYRTQNGCSILRSTSASSPATSIAMCFWESWNSSRRIMRNRR